MANKWLQNNPIILVGYKDFGEEGKDTHIEIEAAFNQLKKETPGHGAWVSYLEDHTAVTPNSPENPVKIHLEKQGPLAGEHGILLIRSDATRSEIYKALKDTLTATDVVNVVEDLEEFAAPSDTDESEERPRNGHTT